MNRRQSLEKGILSPPGSFLTPSPSPSVQSPRLQRSPSQSPFQQDVVLVSNSILNTTQDDRKSLTPQRRLSVNHISPAGTGIVVRPSPTQSPANIINIGNEFNTTLIGSNNLSLNKKVKRTNQQNQQHVSQPNYSPKAAKKVLGGMGSPVASPSPSPTLSSQQVVQQIPLMNTSNSIVLMPQPVTSQRSSIIQTSNTQQSNVLVSNSNTGTLKQNKTPQQILPKPIVVQSTAPSASYTTTNIVTNSSTSTTRQVVAQSKMAIVQQTNQAQQQQFQTSHPTSQIITSNSGSSTSSQSPQVTPGGLILPSGSQPLLLNQMPLLVQQNTPQGVQLILRPQSGAQLAAPGLVIHNRQAQLQQQPQQLLRILNTNGTVLSNQTPTFIVSSQGNIMQNIQGVKTPVSVASQVQQNQNVQRQQQQQIINSHLIGQGVAQIQNLQLNGNITQIQVPGGQQFIQQLPTHFQQNIGNYNQIQPLTAIATSFSSPASSTNGNNDIVSNSNQIQFSTNPQNTIPMNQSAQIISPVATPQPQMISSDQSILTSPPSINFNTQPQTVILTSDKQIHEISSSARQNTNFTLVQQAGASEMMSVDLNQQNFPAQNNKKATKTPKKPKKSKKQKEADLKRENQTIEGNQAPTGKLDLANVMKLCGIMEDDDFMDGDDGCMDQSDSHVETQQAQQVIQVPSNNSANGSNAGGDIMITIPGGSDQPFTFTIPSSSIGNNGAQSASDGKFNSNVPFMIRINNEGQGENGQPYTISIPPMNDSGHIEEHKSGEMTSSSGSVPTYVSSVMNTQVTPTIQSQINDLQNQLMSTPPSKSSAKQPRQKKASTKKNKKNFDKPIEVPTQIGNIQISQIDGTNTKNNKNININNQIQIMPILEKVHTISSSNQVMEKQKMQVPVLQQGISHNSNSHNNNHHHHHHQSNSQSNHSHSTSGPSQVNINVQQNQLINVTNNLQMQVIANPQQQHNSSATPAPPPSSSSGNQQVQSSHVQSSPMNNQNFIGNLMNAQQNQQSGNIIIQGNSFNQQNSNMPGNIQLNIQNQQLANTILSNPPQSQQQMNAQNVLSQLTGYLTLSLSEDGRLILRHDPNLAQDANSNMILQTILTGALGNVTLINEPLKSQNQQTTVGSNGKIHQMATFQKNLIIESPPEPQMTQNQQQFNNVNSGQIVPNVSQIHVSTSKNDSSNPQTHTVVLPNVLKFVELPKIQPNQQLFSLNTLTNEITQLSSNQTTAALSPMERLLIVPSGINAQQLAQCLSQGQIHFNNIGQASASDIKVREPITTSTAPNTVQFHIQKPSNPVVIKKEQVEEKPKKSRAKKKNVVEEARVEIKKEPGLQSPPPPPMKFITNTTKYVKTTAVTTSLITSTTKNTITISPSPMNTSLTSAKMSPRTDNTKSMKTNSISVIPTTLSSPIVASPTTVMSKTTKNQQKTPVTTMNTIVAAPPPLVSVNRVQTIQLTPQKQQSLKNVQNQIQQLSAKLQNKGLLATLSAEIDPENPVHNSPLPILNNISTMTDSEIFNALQRLFIEQQKILATGKIIPTIPTPQMNNSTSSQILKNVTNSNMQQQVFTTNVVGHVSKVSSNQIQTTAIKQEPSSTNPPPLIVSGPIHIKSEFLSTSGNVINNLVSSAPPTGSIIISPKYTTTQNKVEMTVKEKVTIEKRIEVVADVKQEEIDAETLRQNQILEAKQKVLKARSALFERQINVDQQGCVDPDFKSAFAGKEESVKRLIRYHCYYEGIKNEYDPKEEYEMSEKSKMFLASFDVMKKKFQYLLMKQAQQLAPTSEHMMLDRLRIADLKDEIVAMQSEVSSSVPETPAVVKKEILSTADITTQETSHNVSNQPPQPKQSFSNQFVSSLQEPSQILKAKQELKIMENIKQEQQKLKLEVEENSGRNSASPSFQINSSGNLQFLSQSSKFNCIEKPKSGPQASFSLIRTQQQVRVEERKELEAFDIESEIRPNLIMKKNDLNSTSVSSPSVSNSTEKKTHKVKDRKEREFSPLSEFFERKSSVPAKSDASHDPIYDDWFSVKRDVPKKKDTSRAKNQSKTIENDLSDIFETHASPKTVEKQLDDLFNSNSKSNDILSSSSPLADFFHVDSSQMNEKSVENRLEALFGDEESRKESNQDLVESRLEQLFQGSASNDNSVIGNSNFLYKTNELSYEVEEKGPQITNPNKRQWNGDCDIFGTSNSILFPASPSSKRACTTQSSSVNFDSKWIEDSFDFAPDINIISETMGNEITKPRSWNGNIDNRDSIIADAANTSHFNLPSTTHTGMVQNAQHNHGMDLMDSQMPNISYEDPDDISRQVQNAIDSILNLQTSDPLSYSQLDSSFLEVDMNAMSSDPTSMNPHHSSNPMDHRNVAEYAMSSSDHMQNFKQHGPSKRKFLSKMDAIGDCLIGGSNIDHSPSSLVTDSQGTDSAASVGEFVNNLLNCEEKSITS